MALLLPLNLLMRWFKLSPLFKWSVFPALAGGLIFIALYWKGDLPRNTPTEYVETRQVDPAALVGGDEAEASINREGKGREAGGEEPELTAKRLSQAWNQGSSQEIASLFTADGELIIPNGSIIRSKPEIEKILKEKRSGLLNDTTLKSTVEEVSQPDAETAVVRGRYHLDGISILGFNKSSSGTFVLRQLKNGRGWLIAKAELKGDSD